MALLLNNQSQFFKGLSKTKDLKAEIIKKLMKHYAEMGYQSKKK